MDYSHLAHDPDHPEGTSPWNTSPRQSAPTSFSASEDQPPSLLPNATAHPNGSTDQEGFRADEHGDTDRQRVQDTGYGVRADAPKGIRIAEESSGGPILNGNPRSTQKEINTRAAAPVRYQGGIRTQKPTMPQQKLHAKITGLERTGRKDPILRFDVHTNLPKFRTTQFRDVRRTHSEFIKLAEHLISSNPEAFVPAVPLAVTSAGAGTDDDEARVRGSMQRWLNYVCSNEVLMRDDEMILFVESDFGYSPVIRMKQPATGVRRKMIKQLAPPPDDTPELFEARPIVKRFYLGTMDTGQKVDKIVKARRGMKPT